MENRLVCHAGALRRLLKMIDKKDKEYTCKAALVRKAAKKYRGFLIFPCGSSRSLNECFTRHGKVLMFWFNTSKDLSTRMVWKTVSR